MLVYFYMRLHRFIGNFDLHASELTVRDSELINQWRNVLRLSPPDRVILCDGQGHEAQAAIGDMNKKEMRLALDPIQTPDREPHKKAQLFCAVLKRENFELVIQKATEIGISRIVPLITERTVKTGFNRERLEKIIKEAAEQSGRTTLPELADPMPFSEAVDSVNPKESVVFDLSGMQTFSSASSSFNFFIGPEGGFSEKEVSLAREQGCAIASLGTLTFRGETAAIIASYLAVQN